MFNRITFSVAVTSHHVMNIVLPYAHVTNAYSTVTVGSLMCHCLWWLHWVQGRCTLWHSLYRYIEPVLCTDHTHTKLLIYSSY